MNAQLRAIILSLSIFLFAGCGYNSFQQNDESITAAWSEVLNQYQRRADLIPNLVNTVKGYAEHEKDVLESVTKARADATSLNVSKDITSDPQAFEQFQQKQAALSSSIGRLLAVAENYPQLKADGSFRDLQAQLEGTENRITVARKRYIDTVLQYNVLVRSFPSNLTAKMFGYSVKPNFTVENEKGISQPPAVQF